MWQLRTWCWSPIKNVEARHWTIGCREKASIKEGWKTWQMARADRKAIKIDRWQEDLVKVPFCLVRKRNSEKKRKGKNRAYLLTPHIAHTNIKLWLPVRLLPLSFFYFLLLCAHHAAHWTSGAIVKLCFSSTGHKKWTHTGPGRQNKIKNVDSKQW